LWKKVAHFKGRKSIPRDKNWKNTSKKLQNFQRAVVAKAQELGEDLSKLGVQDTLRIAHVLNGYSALPKVVKASVFRKTSKNKKILYRGIAPSTEETAETYIEQFKSGPFFGSSEGSGIFATTSLASAKEYVFPKDEGNKNIGKVMQFFLKSGAKTIREPSLSEIILRYKYQSHWNSTKDFDFKKFLETIFMYLTTTNAIFAEALGKIAIFSNNFKATEKEAREVVKLHKIKISDEHEYLGEQCIVLNRSALVISEKDIDVEVETSKK